ncbi:hypothetical protein PanWU01x14_060690, partial [Parasponia andersonii]
LRLQPLRPLPQLLTKWVVQIPQRNQIHIIDIPIRVHIHQLLLLIHSPFRITNRLIATTLGVLNSANLVLPRPPSLSLPLTTATSSVHHRTVQDLIRRNNGHRSITESLRIRHNRNRNNAPPQIIRHRIGRNRQWIPKFPVPVLGLLRKLRNRILPRPPSLPFLHRRIDQNVNGDIVQDIAVGLRHGVVVIDGHGHKFGVSFGGEELLEKADYPKGLLVKGWLGGLTASSGGGGGGGGRRQLGVARGEAEAREGLLAAAGGFVEDGTVNFGDQNVVVAAAAAVRVRRGRGRGEREGKEVGLGQEAEVDEGNRI